MLELNNIQYHRQKDVVSIDEGQALCLISDIITAALAQNGFTAEIRVIPSSEDK